MIAPNITLRLAEEFAGRRDPSVSPHELVELTQRARGVLALVARGLSNSEIASRQEISLLTVKIDIHNILRTLECRNRAALTTMANASSLIAPGDSRKNATGGCRCESADLEAASRCS